MHSHFGKIFDLYLSVIQMDTKKHSKILKIITQNTWQNVKMVYLCWESR